VSTPVGPYTPIVEAGPWLVCSGQIGLADGALVAGGLEPELLQAMANLAGLLQSKGSSLDAVVKTTVFLKDLSNFDAMNQAYRQFFPSDPPARSCVKAEVALPVEVEIEAIAMKADWFAQR